MIPDRRLDAVGSWTEMKLQILREYSQAYAQILEKQHGIRHFAYIDGFAGAGKHISKTTGKEIEGSPAVALGIQPSFSHYHFIDMNGHRIQMLRELAVGRHDVSIYQGDCNDILLNEVFPQCRYDQRRRALCLLDPYKLNPNWKVVQKAGEMKSIEIFLNFMIMDANMNILRRHPERAAPAQIKRMTDFWGDTSWQEAGYSKQPGLFGEIQQKNENDAIATAYQNRLREVAGFKYVPAPMPMRIGTGSILYYLFFASNNSTGAKIAQAIFDRYRTTGGRLG